MSFDEVWGEPVEPGATYIATGVDTCRVCLGPSSERLQVLCEECLRRWLESPEYSRISSTNEARNRSMISDFVHRLRAERGEH
jgi:hypothetical protein